MSYLSQLQRYKNEKALSSQSAALLEEFYKYYLAAAKQSKYELSKVESNLQTLLDCIVDQIKHPYTFDTFHQRIRQPLDYYSLGISWLEPLIDYSRSKTIGLAQVETMKSQLAKGENVILFANHQSEADPQLISILLGEKNAKFAEEMIFVAGHRVITDPVAVPLSKGRNLLCIWSKKHMEFPPEQKEQKMMHNQKTMLKMSQLLASGGQCIYVAPSGGRDRRDAQGNIDVAPFDPQSVEMFYLMSAQAKTPTHYYPLALSTYNIQPPPESVEQELGERRRVFFSPVGLAFGQEIDMEIFPGSDAIENKKQKRIARTEYIHALVKGLYAKC